MRIQQGKIYVKGKFLEGKSLESHVDFLWISRNLVGFLLACRVVQEKCIKGAVLHCGDWGILGCWGIGTGNHI